MAAAGAAPSSAGMLMTAVGRPVQAPAALAEQLLERHGSAHFSPAAPACNLWRIGRTRRTPDEFRAGHVPGAANVPVWLPGGGGMQPNPEFLREVHRERGQQGLGRARPALGSRATRIMLAPI